MKLEEVNLKVKITHKLKINLGKILVKVTNFAAMHS
jgi:hypothetical protein